jgi:hypothetical protein
MARHFVSATAFALALVGATAASEDDPAAALRARYGELKQQLEQSPFQQPLLVESVEGPRVLQGDVYAIIDHPIGTVSDALRDPAGWCGALILHLNVKYCRAVPRGERVALSVAIGKKYDQPLTSTYRVEFVYSLVASLPDYLDVELNARKGPLGTSSYRFAFEAVSLEDQRTLVHLRYSYSYGLLAKIAMRIYLHGTGGGKAGFTVIGELSDPQPKLIGGVRGIIERNVARYYLAIDAYLKSLTMPAPERFENSLQLWFDATERYSRQLHEVDRDAYFAMKHREYLRQQTAQ